MYSLAEAAKAVSKSKSTLLRAIKKGKISASKDDSGQYQIEPVELFRAYPDATGDVLRDAPNDAPRTTHDAPHDAGEPHEISALQAEVKGLQGQVDLLTSERDDLRGRLDTESEERRKLTMMLTDQRDPSKPAERETTRAGFWVVLCIALAALAVLLLVMSGNVNLSGL